MENLTLEETGIKQGPPYISPEEEKTIVIGTYYNSFLI